MEQEYRRSSLGASKGAVTPAPLSLEPCTLNEFRIKRHPWLVKPFQRATIIVSRAAAPPLSRFPHHVRLLCFMHIVFGHFHSKKKIGRMACLARPLADHLGNVVDDVVELLIALALAVAHGELGVDELAADCDLKGAHLAAPEDLGVQDNFVCELVLEERSESGGEAFVASASSVLDEHRVLWHLLVTVSVGHGLLVAVVVGATAAAIVGVLLTAAVAAVLVAVLVLHLCWCVLPGRWLVAAARVIYGGFCRGIVCRVMKGAPSAG